MCFVTEEQITAESVAITRLILDIYRDFGFEDVRIKFADRPPKRVGRDDDLGPGRGGAARRPRGRRASSTP